LRLRGPAAALLGAGAVAAQATAPAGSFGPALLDAAVAVAFAAGAAAAAAASPRTADLALATAAAWVLGTLASLDGVPAYLAGVAVLLHRAPLALLVLTYPGRRLRGAAESALALGALLAPLAPGHSGAAATAAIAAAVALATAAGARHAGAPLRAPRSAAAAAGAAIATLTGLGAAGRLSEIS
jgi:hypothetical protein